MEKKRNKGKEWNRRTERMRRKMKEENNLRGKAREWDSDDEHEKVLIVKLKLVHLVVKALCY
jgi:hypothetical protein